MKNSEVIDSNAHLDCASSFSLYSRVVHLSLKQFEIALREVRHTLRSNVMHWIAPSEKDTNNAALEKRLWDTADQFCATSGLKA